MRVALATFVAVTALVALPAASAKDFQPGDVRICNTTHCVAVIHRDALRLLAAFYYGDRTPARVRRPKLGMPYYELRYRNGYATGIVATRRLDRFLSYGVVSGRFTRHHWYRVPLKVSREFRRLTRDLRPLPLDRAALAKSH